MDPYYRTPEWQALRARVIARAEGICESCGDAPAVQAHHRTYDRFGRELLSDLRALCRRCHLSEHNLVPQ